MFRTSEIATLALAMSLPIAACEGNTTATEYGTVSLKLTDGNGPEITEARVTFTDIYLQGDNGEADPPGTRTYLMEDGNEEYELTNLQGAVADLVTGAEVPEGDYGQLRIVLGDACIVTSDGVYSSSPEYTACGEPSGTINMTSTQNSGLKVLLHGLHVVGGSQEVLLLDFVVNESFIRQAGNSNHYNFHGVVHGADISLTGGLTAALVLADTVELPGEMGLGDFSATMIPAEGDSARVLFADNGSGVYEVNFGYEQPDMSYTLRLNGPDGLVFTSDPAAEQTLTLSSGETGTVSWTVTSATAAETP